MLLVPVARADSSAEQRSLEEVRNTVINLLQALVERGLLTRDQAQQLVRQAQEKAAADAAAQASRNAAQAKEEENAVRVPYVPQIVKDEISHQVAQEVKPAVVADVVQVAKTERWGVPAALPEWLSRVRVYGDVTVRGQADLYSKDNSVNQLLDYNAINQAGGIAKTTYPFLNTTEDRYRLRLRARLGVEADLTPTLRAFVRLASGSLTDPGSESQTFGTYMQRYTIGIDQAFVVWDSSPADQLAFTTAQLGRMSNPWFTPTELVFARDLSFEGLTGTFRLGWGEGDADRSHVYLTLGGFPVTEVPYTSQLNDNQGKWLAAAQLGTNLRWADGADHLRLGAAYFDFLHVTGQQNAPDSTLLNYTAPAFIRYGNSVFNISNSTTDNTVDLFGLAAKFRLVDVAANYDHNFGLYSLGLTGEAVRNIGYNRSEVEALTGQIMPSKEDTGYVGELSFGHPIVDRFGFWRVAVGYRYVKRDAVIDAFTDADFHEGGTNAAGYYFWTSFGVARNAWVRLRYLSANEIDGPRYGLDIIQLDLNARF
jgi:hypothetical protein